MNEPPNTKSRWWILRRALIGVAVLATLVAIFYTEENWRGRRAWENCKRELEAKGYVMDWDKLIPPPVPDGQNFFKAPKMTERFVRQKSGDNPSNELTPKLNAGFRSKQCQIAELIILPVSTNAPTAGNADMVLRYVPLGMARFSPVTAVESYRSSTDFRIRLIRFEDVPITFGISNLALQVGINVTLDPKIGYGQPDQNGQIKPEPRLSFQWTNITAKGALGFILNKYNLQLIYDPTNNLAHITTNDADTQKIHATPDVHDELMHLFAGVIGTNIISVYQNYVILARPPEHIKPMRIVVESDTIPDTSEMRELFAESFPNGDANTKFGESIISIESDGPDAFRVMLGAVAAADYLEWSDQFESDFGLIREALKRPYARMDGNYTIPSEGPVPNFVAVRIVAQTLAQRTGCHFLLNQPEQALDDLTLMHDMRLILEGAPTHKPMTLVAAMINVAVAGLYVDTINEGFRLHAWKEPQIAALQKQLAQINLFPYVFLALQREPVGSSRTFEIADQKLIFGPWKGNDLKHPLFWLLEVAPRGWVYQNMAVNCELQLKFLSNEFDPANDVISPREVNKFAPAIDAFVGGARHSPFRILAAIAIPNFTKAWQATTHNQTTVNEAQIACALERYHLAHGEYPETLDALVPQFIEKLPHDIIGGQPLHYRRTDEGKFLLYSVGWNETDDGGQESPPNQNGGIDYTKGDWVWKN